MWCELNLHAKLSDAHIQKLASFFSTEPTNDAEDDSLADSPLNSTDAIARPDSEKAAGVHNWNEMEVDQLTESSCSLLPKNATNKSESRNRWINACLIASSSNVDVLVFALVQKFVIFERLSDGRMELSAQVEVNHNIDVSEGYIASICILPVACPGNRKSDTSVNDWTCIAVGLSSGFVNFYSERGVLVFSEKVSYSSVKSLRFGASSKRGGQEFAILTENQIVVIEGSSLYSTLRSARAQIARGEETLEGICNSLEVKCHRYEINRSRGCVDDFLVTGPIKPSSVDQYVAASLSESGCETKLVRTSLPTYSTYLTIGEAPFSSFVWFDESVDTTNLLSDTFYNITNQVTTVVTAQLPSFGIRSFLGIGTSRRNQPQKKLPVDVRNVAIPTRSSLDDGGRYGERVYASPRAWNLAAIADGSARVLLINTNSRQVVRIWKGYRDARCAWIESTGKVSNESRGKALFLAIFAPRRGLLEVWAMQNGPRVSAFNVDRSGRLIGIGSTNQLLLGHSEQKGKIDSFTSAVFVSSNGQIHRLSAPFHLALSGSSTASVHDENLLKELCGEKDFEELKWKRVVGKMKTVSARRRAVEFLVELKQVDVSVKGKLCELIREEIHSKQRLKKGLSAETSLFLSYLNAVLQLMDVFATIASFDSFNDSLNINEEMDTEISKKLRVNSNELSEMMDCMNRYMSVEDSTDEGIEIKVVLPYSFVSFLREFSFEHLTSVASPDDASEKSVPVWIPQTLKNSSSTALGNFLFLSVLSGRCSISDFFQRVAPCIGIDKRDFLNCFCVFWLQKSNSRPAYYLPHVLSFVEHLIAFSVSNEFTEDAIAQMFEQHLNKSSEVLSGLMLCLVVRAVLKSRKEGGRKEDNAEENEVAVEATEHWEPLAVDLWDILLTHLRLLTVLATLPKAGEVCLESLRSSGCGYYREQIGAWAASYMVNPDELYEILSRPMTFEDHCDIDDFRPPLEKELKDALSSGKEIDSWKFAIYDLRKHLPFSFVWYLVVCDCAWECFTHWHRLPGTKPVRLLKNAVKYVKFLNSWPHLQHGIALIAWDTFLRQPFQNLYELLNEKGVQPEDHLIRMQVGVSETELIAFVEVMHDILQLLCVSVVDLDQIPLPKQEYEDFLIYFMEYNKGKLNKVALTKRNDKLCLSELVCRKKSVNYHLVLHHIHLALVMQLQITVHARAKPSSLFCDIGKRAFFESFHRHPLIPLDAVDDHLKTKRQSFAMNMVKHITETSSSHETMNKNMWNVLLDLAREWKLDTDALRRREVELLYKDAYDSQAAHLVPSVVDRGALGCELFKITVSRLKALHDQSGSNLLKEFEKYQLGAARTIELIRHTPEKLATHHAVDWSALRELASVTDELLQAGDRKNSVIRQLQKTIGELINMIEHAKRFV